MTRPGEVQVGRRAAENVAPSELSSVEMDDRAGQNPA